MKPEYWFSTQRLFKVFFCISISLFLAGVSIAHAQDWISFENGKRGTISVEKAGLGYRDISVDAAGAQPQCRISLAIPGAFISYPDDNGLLAGKYASLSFNTGNIRVMGWHINGTVETEKLGKPELPFIRIQVKIPYSVNAVNIRVANTNFKAVEGVYKVAPVQEQLFESFIPGIDADNRTFKMDKRLYATDHDFSYGIEYEIGICHGYKILDIRYSPVQYNPVTQTILATGSAEIVITYLDGQVRESDEVNIFTDVVNRATFDGINGSVNDVVNPVRGGKVVVVSNTTLLNSSTYAQYKAYRQSQGYTFIREINAGSQTGSAIAGTLRSQYSSEKFQYLIIMGDWTIVPIPTDVSDGYHWKNYSWLEGNDKIPDVCMGIFLADNETKLGYIFNRQKQQEAGGTWSKTVMMTAHIEDSGNNWDRFSTAHYATRNMDRPNSGLGYTCNRVYLGKHTNYSSYGGSYGVPRTTFESWALNPNPFTTSAAALRDKVAQNWNTMGNVVIGHRDHGSTSGPSPMTYAMFNGSITGTCSPLFTSLNCTSGNVKRTTVNFTYMSQTKAIGTCVTISATRVTMSGDNDYNHMGMYDAMFPANINATERNIGKVFLAGMLKARDHGRTYFHVWGDPMTNLALGSTTPFIALTSPNGGENIEQNTACMIQWSDNIPGNVKIELLKGGNVAATVASSTASNGLYEWHVGSTAPGSDYRMKISSVSEPALNSTSANDFTIAEEYIIKDYVYYESFDTLTHNTEILPFRYEQLSTDDRNWTVWSGPTPSRIDEPQDVTGPIADNTTGAEDGIYIYTEASGNNVGYPNKTFHFITPKFNFTALTKPVLSFFYHMFSDNQGQDRMGTLSVDINVDGQWHSEVIKISGNQEDAWKEKTLDLTPYKSERTVFRFRGITGAGWESDICIDDIKIFDDILPVIDISAKLPASFDLGLYGSRIHFRVPAHAAGNPVAISLYTLQGKQVTTLVNRRFDAGNHTISLPRIAAGMYLCRMESGGFVKMIPLLLRK